MTEGHRSMKKLSIAPGLSPNRKRPTKAQRIADEKAALRRRVLDIALGVYGGTSATDPNSEYFPGFACDMGIEDFGKFVAAMKREWSAPKSEAGWIAEFFFEPRMMHRFDTLDGAVDTLYQQGVRA